LDQAVVMLRKSYRFSPTSGIGRLVQALQQDTAVAGRSLADIREHPPEDIRFVVLRPGPAALSASAALVQPPVPVPVQRSLFDETGPVPAAADPVATHATDWLNQSGIMAEHGYPALFRQLAEQPSDD